MRSVDMPTDQSDVEMVKLQLELLKVREASRNERQKNIINMVLGLASTFLGVYNAVQIADARSQVRRVYDDTPSVAQVAAVSEKVDANLLQWKAYKTKDSADETRAAEALGRAVADMP